MAKLRKNRSSSHHKEDWLDNEAPKHSGRRPSKVRIKKTQDKTFEINAKVVQVHPKLCHVLMDSDQSIVLCHYKRSQVYDHSEVKRRGRTPFAVGDRVAVVQGVIEALEPRVNKLLRVSPERDQKTVQVLASNIDILFIVTSVVDPVFSPGLVDRFLISAQSENIPTVILLNKWDLEKNKTIELDEAISFYKNHLGVDVLYLSTVSGEGLGELNKLIRGKTTLFCGHSGVGKTSLVNSLLECQQSEAIYGKTGNVNSVTKKGKHTTSSALLYALGLNTHIIDTPGVRSFGLNFILHENLIQYFPELQSLSCRSECSVDEHTNNCELIASFRGKNYLKILDELKEK